MEAQLNESKQNRIVLKNVEIGELLDEVNQIKKIKSYTKIVTPTKQPILDYDDELGDDIFMFKTLKNN